MKVNGQWVPCVCNSSFSFMPIHLKLYMCYGHGLKICKKKKPCGLDIILGLFFVIFGHFSEWIEGTIFSGMLVNG